MDNMIEIKDVKKVLGKKDVLKNINLDIQKGVIYGLIGPSGAGKTTLVKLMVGMEKADSGSVSVLEKEMPSVKLLQHIGYMAQSDALYEELTGEENLKFFGSLFKLSYGEQKKRIEYVANLVHLTDDLKKKVHAYSGGMKRRLSLAVALIQDPDVLVLDEPTVGMDPVLRASIWQELNRLKSVEHKTIIVTTHVMDEAVRCDCLSLIREGEIIASGTPVELVKLYDVKTLEDVFIVAKSTVK